MYKTNRCNERPMIYQEQSSIKYQEMPEQSYMMSGTSQPIYECPQENVCHKQFMHEVNHIVPINTRIINHHIYKHTYTPYYTCCEENEFCNVYDTCNKMF